jgi:hypothetical protein
MLGDFFTDIWQWEWHALVVWGLVAGVTMPLLALFAPNYRHAAAKAQGTGKLSACDALTCGRGTADGVTSRTLGSSDVNQCARKHWHQLRWLSTPTDTIF